jgi:hypothetical protein
VFAGFAEVNTFAARALTNKDPIEAKVNAVIDNPVITAPPGVADNENTVAVKLVAET